jgi:hypothetical protein
MSRSSVQFRRVALLYGFGGEMKTMNKLLLLSVLAPVLAFTQGTAGKTGFEFLRTEISARQTGMAGAFVAVDGDVYGLTCNPASLAGLKRRQAAATYVDYLLDFQLGFAGFSSPLKSGGMIGMGIGYANYGTFQWTDESGNATGSSVPGDVLFTAAYANGFSKTLRYGVSLRYIRSNIQNYSASAAAANAGILLLIPRQQMTFGFAVLNAGNGLSGFRDTVEKVPTSLRAGVTKRLQHLPLMVSIDATKFLYESDRALDGVYWVFGGEFTVSNRLLLRFGYNSRGSEERMGANSSRVTGIALGMGLLLRNLRIDYSRNSYGILGAVNTFGVTADF